MARVEVGNITIYYNEKSEWAEKVVRMMVRELVRRGGRRWRRER